MMMNNWLKLACIGLLGYVLVFSLYVPLVPGGLHVDTEKIRPGVNEFVFTGYNTHFLSERKSLQVLIMSGNTTYCGEVVSVSDNAHVSTRVVLPDTLPSTTITFFVNNDVDGTLSVFSAIDMSSFVFAEGYKKGSCEMAVSNNEHIGFGFPFQHKLYEGIRNLMFHVPMWFTMFFLMIMSFAYGMKCLRGTKNNNVVVQFDNTDISHNEKLLRFDRKSADYAKVGLVFCMLGLITGSIWARFTWGDWWTSDPQLNGALAVFIAYSAYLILRSSTLDPEKRARLSAIYNIFAFVMMVILLMIMPRFYDSMHPGKGGNPAFNSYDLDSSLRAVFYPAVIGWILLGYWIYALKNRISNLTHKRHEQL